MKIKSILFILCFFAISFMCAGCASIPEEQKSDTYEVEAYEIYIAPTAVQREQFKNQYIYIVYEKDIKLAKKTAQPVFVDKWTERTNPVDRFFLNINSRKEEAYAKSIGLEESYRLGTNTSGSKKYFIDAAVIYEADVAFSKVIKNMFKIGKNDRFYALRLLVDAKEKYAGKTFTYDCIASIGNSKNGKRLYHLYTDDEACFKEFEDFERQGVGCYTEKLR